METPTYWTGIEELESTSQQQKGANNNEFATEVPVEQKLENATDEALGFSTNRRDFLKLFGFGLTAATLAACNESPIKKAIPYVVKPDDIVPGVPNYYSSTCGGCSGGCGVMVKTREGRPIKVEGNPDSPLSRGALCAVGQASVLNLYDIDRLKSPMKGKTASDWRTVDNEIGGKLAAAQGKVRVLTHTVISPSTLSAIDDFCKVYGGQHVTYDAVSTYAIAKANELSFGKLAIPSFHFEKADVIVSFGADFLGTWISPVQFSRDYVANRNPKMKKMSRHFQIESMLSLTGSNADVRFPINPASEGVALLNLYNKVALKLGKPVIEGVASFNVAGSGLDTIANELAAAAGRSLVVCGTNDVAAQQIVNGLNAMLGNYGTTLDLSNPSFQKQGNDAALKQLVDELKSGAVSALVIYGANPVYDTPYAEDFKNALAKLPLSVSFAYKTDETSALCQYTCPDSHEMESWNDANPVAGQYSINQPTINTIFDTRQAQQTLLNWSGTKMNYLDYLKANWRKNIQSGMTTAQWEDLLRTGVYLTEAAPVAAMSMNWDLKGAAAELGKNANATGMQVVLYEKIGIRDGKHANNPWLQELPDPVTRTCWDNYATVSVAYAKEKNLKDNDVIEIKVGAKSVKLPILHQVGQAKDTIGIALGYGRDKEMGKTLSKVSGENVFGMVNFNQSNHYSLTGATVTVTGTEFPIAKFQKYDLLTDPSKAGLLGGLGDSVVDRTHHIMRETTLENYIKNPTSGNEERIEAKKGLLTLWDSHYEDTDSKRLIRWVMAIDLNKCTGCGACVVACNAENNIPVVGKKEIMNHRDMHWMRIDRYYAGEPENPSVVFQPMLCQHCANAPCETVCPVLATVHTSDGLNSMAYNRCVGTRYCANNCPYKVRRFNWFKYHNNDQFDFHMNNELGKLVLNPDVTVRFRGVMEKCSFCVHRIQDAKLRAKINVKQTDAAAFAKPKDGDLQTACQQTCPTGAIVFGDLNDAESEVAKLFRDDRAFTVLEEVKTLPSISYMTKVRNQHADEVKVKPHHGEHPAVEHTVAPHT